MAANPIHTICFITANYEPGSDGVSDYTRVFSRFARLCGCIVSVISFNDSFVQTLQELSTTDGQVVRIPSAMPYKQRVQLLDKYLTKINPDLVSLQFQTFGFKLSGLPGFDLLDVANIIARFPYRQIMFHELWAGLLSKTGSSLIRVGNVQRHLILRFIKKINPQTLFTSTQLYTFNLHQAGFSQAQWLPLVSNISIIPEGKDKAIKLFKEFNIDDHEQWVKIGLFGSVYFLDPARGRKFFERIITTAEKSNKKVALIFFGKSKPEGLRDFLKKLGHLTEIIKTIELGQQPEDVVSGIMQLLEKGIILTPDLLVGKSGVRASYLYHNVEPINLGISPSMIPFSNGFNADDFGQDPTGPSLNHIVLNSWRKTTFGE